MRFSNLSLLAVLSAANAEAALVFSFQITPRILAG